jgi:hypothetical protein
MTDLDEQDRRIAKILGTQQVPEVNGKALREYLEYLKKNLEFPCRVTGTETFPWEERYVFGHGDKEEYEKLKKTQPSHTDIFELLSLDDEVDEDSGIIANVKRVSDERKFRLTLDYLEAMDEQSKNHELLDDYSVWFVNYR